MRVSVQDVEYLRTDRRAHQVPACNAASGTSLVPFQHKVTPTRSAVMVIFEGAIVARRLRRPHLLSLP